MAKPAQNIVWSDEDNDWMCIDCQTVGYCDCLEGMSDPICDCGHVAYDCWCHTIEDRK